MSVFINPHDLLPNPELTMDNIQDPEGGSEGSDRVYLCVSPWLCLSSTLLLETSSSGFFFLL